VPATAPAEYPSATTKFAKLPGAVSPGNVAGESEACPAGAGNARARSSKFAGGVGERDGEGLAGLRASLAEAEHLIVKIDLCRGERGESLGEHGDAGDDGAEAERIESGAEAL